MKIVSALFLILVLPAVVSAGKDYGGSKDSKDSKDSGDGKDMGKPSFFSRIIGSFKTVLDILKTGDASELAQSACDGLVEGLGVLDSMDCLCSGELVTGFQEIRADVECVATSDACLTNDTEAFCGGVLLLGTLMGGSALQLSGEATACLSATLPHDLGESSVCISVESLATTPGVGIDTCTATLNEMPCTCTPCEGSDFAVTFDCSSVDLSPFPGIPVYGPKVDTCKKLSFQSS